MKSAKQLLVAQRVAQQQQEIISELRDIVTDMNRCESTITTLKQDLQEVNARFAERKSTQDDIQYLEGLLACAKRKLVWEKHMASLQKRTPALMERVEMLVNHPESNPDEKLQKDLLESVKSVQAAMNRLQEAKL